MLPGPFRHDGVQFMIVFDPVRVFLKFGPINQIFPTDDLTEPFPDRIVAHGNHGPAVRGRERVVRIDEFVTIADPPRDPVLHQIQLDDGFHGADDGVDQGHIHTLAAPGYLPAFHSRQNADAAVKSGQNIAHRGSAPGRRRVRPTGNTHQAAHRLTDDVIAGTFPIRAILAESRYGGKNQPGVYFL